HHLLAELSVEMIGSSEDRAAGPVKADSQPKAGAMASLNRACPGLAHTRLPTSTSDSHHPFLQSNRLGEKLKRCTKKALEKRWGVRPPAHPVAAAASPAAAPARKSSRRNQQLVAFEQRVVLANLQREMLVERTLPHERVLDPQTSAATVAA